ncbi:MAG: hypothetical protein NUK62_08445 [Tenericutes bacterium]|nr:hypothetical protein [Mycoplasmatota bacterium]
MAFRGVTIENICSDLLNFRSELFSGIAQLRGHLGNIKHLKEIDNDEEVPLHRLLTIFNRFHLVANQLKRRRNNKTPYLIEDEYDVQNLLLAILKIDFDDVRKEDWAPSYAGGASRIDFVLKSEGILIEVKKASQNLREKQIGEQLLVDIEKYKEHPNVSTLICFIYDLDNWIDNPRGFETDLQKCSAKELKVVASVCP